MDFQHGGCRHSGGFSALKPGGDYDGLYASALCRSKADWLVGINATRLFSVLYHRTLNIGRVMSPTLALIVQREAEISAFKPVRFIRRFWTAADFLPPVRNVPRKRRPRRWRMPAKASPPWSRLWSRKKNQKNRLPSMT